MKKTKRRVEAVNLLLLFSSVILFIIVSEAVSRQLLPADNPRFNCDNQDIGCYMANWERQFSNLTMEANGSEEFRIAIIGDSFTAGRFYDHSTFVTDASFPETLEHLLNSNLKDRHYSVLNLGFDGATTMEELLILENFAMRYDPDMVIIQVANNDAVPQVYNLDELRYCNIEASTGERIQQRLLNDWKLFTYLYTRLRWFKSGQLEEMETDYFGFRCFNASLHRIGSMLAEKGIRGLAIYVYDVAFFHKSEAGMKQDISLSDSIDEGLVRMFDDAFASAGFDYLNTHIYFEGIPAGRFLADDLYHYNAYGNEVLAGGIFDYLVQKGSTGGCENENCSPGIPASERRSNPAVPAEPHSHP